MSLTVENDNGDLMWSPNDFGTYSVEKIQVIADILKEIFKNTPITLSIDSTLSGGSYYTKEESNQNFVLKTDFSSLASDLVKSLVTSYLKDKETSGDLANSSTQKDNIRVLGLLTKICFDQTYEGTVSATETPTFTPFPLQIQNLTELVNSDNTNISHLLSVVYEVNNDGTVSSRVNVATLKDLEAVNTSINSVNNSLDSMNGSISTINSQITDIKSDVKKDNTTLTSLKNEVGNLSDFSSGVTDKTSIIKAINSLEARISAIETKLSKL